MKGFDKLNIKSAVKSHSKIDLSFTHLTTLNFGQIVPVQNLEVIPGDKINIDTSVFSRMAPLYVPTYGKAALKVASFYVPYHQIAEDFEAYIAGKSSWMGQTPVLRYTTLEFLGSFFSLSSVSENGTATNYDFLYKNASGVIVYRKLTAFGKYAYKVLKSLGYQIPDAVDLRTDSVWLTRIKNTIVNAMPLLAFCKVYNDYMSQSQRYNSSELSTILLNIRQNKAYTSGNVTYSTNGRINHYLIEKLLDSIKLCYENDMFVSAWQNPNNPLGNSENVTSISAVKAGSNGTDIAILQNTNTTYLGTTTNGISQRALNFLQAFDNWVRRNNYAGSRDVQQIYARFGIKADDYKTHYSHCLGVKDIPLQVGDVTATNQTTDMALGDYAGKGIISGGDKFSVDCTDFGQVITLAWISVKPMYADGFDYSVLKSQPLDFYNPEFDGIGIRAIPQMEVAAFPAENNVETSVASDSVFGFTERYNEYRYSKDKITGDFDLSSDMDAWHFNRNLYELRRDGNLVAQSGSFVNQLPTESEYDRIFNVPAGDEDKFYLTMNFGITALRPIKNLNEVADLGVGSVSVDKNGNTLN